MYLNLQSRVRGERTKRNSIYNKNRFYNRFTRVISRSCLCHNPLTAAPLLLVRVKSNWMLTHKLYMHLSSKTNKKKCLNIKRPCKNYKLVDEMKPKTHLKKVSPLKLSKSFSIKIKSLYFCSMSQLRKKKESSPMCECTAYLLEMRKKSF